MIVQAVPDNHVAGERALGVFHLRIAGKRDRLVGHAALFRVNINRLVAGRMVGVAFVVQEINHHVRLGHDVIHVPARLPARPR